MRKNQYNSPVVLWKSSWKEIGSETRTTKNGDTYEIKVYSLYGTPNKEYKNYLGSKK